MSYIGKSPVAGNFVKLDTITTSATTTFNLLNGGVAYYPASANNCLVSLNGILQAPTDSYTISGSTIIFSSALTTSDVIDFIIVLGDVLSLATVSDSTIGIAKLTATGTPSSSTFLRGDNTWGSAGATAGQVIQVVSTTKTDTFSTTVGVSGTGFVDITSLSVSITPSSTSNKILVFYNIMASNSNTSGRVYFKLKRATTDVVIGDAFSSCDRITTSYFQQGGTVSTGNSSFNYLDSPASTSALTYKVQTCSNGGDGTYTTYINRQGNTGAANDATVSTITVMEIKG
jgi:hypothetical protein